MKYKLLIIYAPLMYVICYSWAMDECLFTVLQSLKRSTFPLER